MHLVRSPNCESSSYPSRQGPFSLRDPRCRVDLTQGRILFDPRLVGLGRGTILQPPSKTAIYSEPRSRNCHRIKRNRVNLATDPAAGRTSFQLSV